MVVVELLEIPVAAGIDAPTDRIAPGPGATGTRQLLFQLAIERAAGFIGMARQQLQMAMGLAGPGGRCAVEKPETIGIGCHVSDRLPIRWREPACLGHPLLADQQQMGRLDGKFIEQHHMAGTKQLHLQVGLPGQKGIRLGPACLQMLGGTAEQAPQPKWFKAGQGQQLRAQGHQRPQLAGPIALGQGLLPVLLSSHRIAASRETLPGSSGPRSRCRSCPAGPAPGLRADSCSPPGCHGLPG